MEKFQAQKETSKRLALLRTKGEDDKHQLEKEMERMTMELESQKYAEAKDMEMYVFFLITIKKYLSQ